MRPLNGSRAVATLVVLTCMVGVIVVCHYEAWRHQEILLDGEHRVEIQSGDTFSTIASDLEVKGIIQNMGYFELLARVSDATGSIQAGEYLFSGSYTPSRVLQELIRGNVVNRLLTLPEGGTLSDFVQILATTPKLDFDIDDLNVGTALEELGLEQVWEGIPTSHGEGWFFPDSYQYTTPTSASDVLRTAYAKMTKELGDVWQNRDQSTHLTTPYELLILASIIEKESGVIEDQRQIGGVFSRRLIKGMRLQADPTVIYGLGETFTGNLTRRHLRTDNPYNTYLRYGLPPTPIAAPSLAALQAAANPASGDALYFVARGDGTSEFSATLEEHNRAVRKYQLNREN